MTDRKTATCACGNPMYPQSERCQICHMAEVHEGTRQRHARNRRRKDARRWAPRLLGGEPGGVRPGADMSDEEFKSALRDTVLEIRTIFNT